MLSADRQGSAVTRTVPKCSLLEPGNGQQGCTAPCRRFGSKVLSSEEARQLGLPSGSSQWLEADINCFASCLSRCGKDFGLIAQQLQPPKSRGEVVCFYYDMWKTRRIPRARQWYNSMKAEVKCAGSSCASDPVVTIFLGRRNIYMCPNACPGQLPSLVPDPRAFGCSTCRPLVP